MAHYKVGETCVALEMGSLTLAHLCRLGVVDKPAAQFRYRAHLLEELGFGHAGVTIRHVRPALLLELNADNQLVGL